jgi:hypothetical protein
VQDLSLFHPHGAQSYDVLLIINITFLDDEKSFSNADSHHHFHQQLDPFGVFLPVENE